MTPTFTAADRQRVFERILIGIAEECEATRPARLARQQQIDGAILGMLAPRNEEQPR